ncbi:unnamed protein product [Vitrella brassicaformis CCMP3155]|uniref:Uncharacterized protein n=1 Tax=Vitrella brassicaformis (strain CCMP3155) TaxID=1169540 RepID=A0A0G4GVG6_VITBC|nr:unnamed protein product [Vitrella brassicaformis CCMP3155]|eukprot:CEM34882.1 unnamed protein product [Vitrella brassicaformis CCMP3155]
MPPQPGANPPQPVASSSATSPPQDAAPKAAAAPKQAPRKQVLVSVGTDDGHFEIGPQVTKEAEKAAPQAATKPQGSSPAAGQQQQQQQRCQSEQEEGA